jgi:hypothetical protein
MKQSSFWKLVDMLAPNSDNPPSVRLAIALRYFAGGDPIDLCAVHSANTMIVHQSIWLVVQAINHTKSLQISYPTKHEDQQKIAEAFFGKSAAGFNKCAGCIDGILIWINKPSIIELETLGIGGKKFFCGRKKNSD